MLWIGMADLICVDAESFRPSIPQRGTGYAGDSVDKVIKKLGKKYSTRIEQGAKVYTYQDSKNKLIQEFWTVDGKVQIIRLKTKRYLYGCHSANGTPNNWHDNPNHIAIMRGDCIVPIDKCQWTL